MKKRTIKTIKVSLIVVLFLCGMSRTMAQNLDSIQAIPKDSVVFNEDEFRDLALPPLEVLFANAAKGPNVRFADLKVTEQKLVLNKEKRAWANFFNVGTGYHYGNMGIYSSYSDATTPLMSQYTGQTNTSWQVGANFNMSLEALLDLRPRIKRQRIAIEMAEMQREAVLDELRALVVTKYVDAKLQISLLKLQAQAVIYANAMFKMNEQDFLNGQKDQSDISIAKSNQSKALEFYENTKSRLLTSLLELEILTKTPIVNKSTK